MIVKFKGNLENADLKKDHVYKVISVSCIRKSINSEDYLINYRILNDLGTVALYKPSGFEIIDGALEEDTIINFKANGNLEFMPKNFCYDSFWEDFFNGEKSAEKIFKERFPNDFIF